MKNQKKSNNDRMSEYGDVQGNAVTALFQAAKTSDNLLAMQRGVAFLVSQFTPEAVLEIGKSTEAVAWGRRAVREMWTRYDHLSERGNLERKAEAEGKLVRFPQSRRS